MPGSVVVVPDTAYKTSTPAVTIKDVLDYVPGVFVQPKWGEDTRLSIRGSGLSRNFHLRSVQLFMDGIPINTADGYGDFQEIDPSAYRYVEVYKGANALRYGANALGGAINFVTPTGRDASLFGASADIGSFGFHRLQASSGGAQRAVRLLRHRLVAGAGRLPRPQLGRVDARQRQSRLPALARRRDALLLQRQRHHAAHPGQRDAKRGADVADRPRRPSTSPTTGSATSTPGASPTRRRSGCRPAPASRSAAFFVDRHLMHPIFQWLDYQYEDYGGFARLTRRALDRRLQEPADRRRQPCTTARSTTGQFVNSPSGRQGRAALAARSTSRRTSRPTSRTRSTSCPTWRSWPARSSCTPRATAPTGSWRTAISRARTEFDVWSPKVGLLWEVDRTWQVFANVSRSAEVPSFGENSLHLGIAFSDIKAQTATTYEIGTRGRRPDYTWDLAAYRAEIDNELQCLFSAFGNCTVVNADRTVHQGLEIGFGVAVAQVDVGAGRPSPDRLWLNVAYTLNDFRFDGDAKFGNNVLPGAPRHFLRAELLYKHPSGVFFGPNVEWVPQAYFVDSANTLEDRGVRHLGPQARLRQRRAVLGLHRGPQPVRRDLHRQRQHHRHGQPGASPLFEPGTGRAVFAGINVVVGYNGCGKTQLLANLANTAHADLTNRADESFIRRYGEFPEGGDAPRFSSVIAISYSAFDTFDLPGKNRQEEDRLESSGEVSGYTYCGLRRYNRMY